MDLLEKHRYQMELEKLESPFNWDLPTKLNYQSTDVDNNESDPIIKLIRYIMRVYLNVMANENSEIIFDLLKKCDENLKELKERLKKFFRLNNINT